MPSSSPHTSTNTNISVLPAHFSRVDGVLHCEGVDLSSVAAQHSTPTYVYSSAAITDAYQAYATALQGRRAKVYYALKANSNLSVVKLLQSLGAGFDIVSAGELACALAVGAKGADIVFSGVGKSVTEMQTALNADVGCFNLESIPELDRLNAVALEMGKVANISVRVNPDVDPKTHPYISTGLKENKFGVAKEDALALYTYAASLPGVAVIGIDCHIGSQITTIAPYLDALDRVLDLVEAIEAAGVPIHHLDLGGGIGIDYALDGQLNVPPVSDFMIALLAKLDARGHGHRALAFEPGRSLVGNAGVLLTTVEYLKPTPYKNYAIVDAGMNDLMRPSLYQAYHASVEVVQTQARSPSNTYDVVGPVCESGCWLGKDRDLIINAGDVIALLSAGAYAMSMASSYNVRGRGAEILVSATTAKLVRPRETIAQMLASQLELI
jgi:diaminopimelate decarboxylase